jgi:hypothetical protein
MTPKRPGMKKRVPLAVIAHTRPAALLQQLERRAANEQAQADNVREAMENR